MSATAGHGLRFVFYGRTKTPMPARSQGAVRERERQLAIARSLAGGSGLIAISYFETRSDFFSTWRHRPKARRIIDSLSNPDRGFDAIVVADTRAVMSVHEFDRLTFQCLLYSVQLWCPETGGRFEPQRSSHQEIMRRFFWMSAKHLLDHDFGIREQGPPPPPGESRSATDGRAIDTVGQLLGQSSGARPRWVPNSRL